MNLLVTGGAGFIGSNFILYMLEKHNDIRIINLDKLTYAGNLENLECCMDDPRHFFIKGDICDLSLVEKVFSEYEIDGVIHFAAESHVDNSITNPRSFVETNVLGTFTLLEAARNFWMDGVNSYKKEYMNARFYHISTDEVYGSLGKDGYFTEDTAYAPNSPYSASKASSDMLVRSYFHTYGMNVVTTNCSNNYGPRQHEEKLIPTIIRKALALEPIPIYGNGQNVRDWLYVMDHCRAIEQVYLEGKAGETYLIGGHNERTNIEIAQTVCDVLDELIPLGKNECGTTSYKQLISFVHDRPGHDFRYAINDSKLQRELGFQIKYGFDRGITGTVHYYLQQREKLKVQ
ncbi:dTDP-glucose 4,6-dehydratase [Robertmurraya andreesenii]|uniref:dTDP-glucose 4,6-dehydratase n=1 Tax=Anoxybacillus andreesenii TaxID=1325932 RepID=A0ABT9V354_9BACL|nr:dTDP-glucose 4,6-dehydratase [Robertmurraya andreesenii]MDQ0155375.1 dTDP-glucose 4,6-dehydratase [Robertmurraya andreesenii]